MRTEIEKWKMDVIERLCDRVNRHDFKIATKDCSDGELYVLRKLEKSHAPYDGWWYGDTNIFVEYDYDHDSWDIYCGNGWI